MFTTIFTYELKYWLRQPSIYFYTVVLFMAGMIAVGGIAGAFDPPATITGVRLFANAPIRMIEIYGFLMQLVLFLLPAIIGVSVYRDFNSRMHHMLYTLPITRAGYIWGKFLSSFTVAVGVVFMLVGGMYGGTLLPTANPALLAPFEAASYVRLLAIYIVPNILTFGFLIFAVILFTRNIYAGFILIITLLAVQGIIGNVLGGVDASTRFWAGLLDPFGETAAAEAVRYWSLSEQNTRQVPFSGIVLFNRLVWFFCAVAIFSLAYARFQFNHQVNGFFSGIFKKAKEANFRAAGSILRLQLPRPVYQYHFRAQLRNMLFCSRTAFMYMLCSWMFIVLVLVGILFVFYQQAQMNLPYGFKILPVTWQMLRVPSIVFSGVIYLITFLYAGILVQRAQSTNMQQLLDVCPLPNWVVVFGNFLALVKMQALLLSFIVLGGICVQISRGYYQFEPGLYLFETYVLNLPSLAIWAFAAVFVQTLIRNPYLGMFSLLLGASGVMALPEFGIEDYVFRFGHSPAFNYTDMSGYGASLPGYLVYKAYWLIGGCLLLIGALLFHVRGIPYSLKERLQIAGKRLRGRVALVALLFFTSFLSMGGGLYFLENYYYDKINSLAEADRWRAISEKRYGNLSSLVQPRITDVKINIDLFPQKRRFTAQGTYTLTNKVNKQLDTLLINYAYHESTRYEIERAHQVISRDSLVRFDILRLATPLLPGDSILMNFEIDSKPHNWLDPNPRVKQNGTFIRDNIFPKLGCRNIEITNKNKRQQYGLPAVATTKNIVGDSLLLGYANPGNQTDWIRLETVISTDASQTALAPGELLKTEVKGERKSFHYKTEGKVKHEFVFQSAKYQLKKDRWNDLDLEIYYHKGHQHNLERLFKGMKASLSYNSHYFGEYPHSTVRIAAFPLSEGSFATNMANIMPYSEVKFLADVDTTQANNIDLPFYMTVHELSHQWWGNQFISADIPGKKFLTESVAEYVALKVLERTTGTKEMHKFRRLFLDSYLNSRNKASTAEKPLIKAAANMDYINYRRGGLVLYALSDFIGEENINRALSAFESTVRYGDPPFPTAKDLVKHLRAVTPDTLQYFISDMIENVTLYDNRASISIVRQLDNGEYEVELDVVVSKFRNDDRWQRVYSDSAGEFLMDNFTAAGDTIFSLPLDDYIEVGIFAMTQDSKMSEGKTLYLKKHRINGINNRFRIKVKEQPYSAGIDPFLKLPDVYPGDNLQTIRTNSQ